MKKNKMDVLVKLSPDLWGFDSGVQDSTRIRDDAIKSILSQV